MFAEQNIDYSVLPDLTEDDLEKLGVSRGHRKKLLRAIDAMRPARQSRDTTEVLRIGTEAISPVQHRDAEFRQITVMFCDLVDIYPARGEVRPRGTPQLLTRIGGSAARRLGTMEATSPAISVMA